VKPLGAVLVLLIAHTGLPMVGSAQRAGADAPFQHGDRVVIIGNTFAERMSLFPHFEAELSARLPEAGLTFRNLGWSGDEITLMPRPLNFGDMHTHLEEQRADVVLAFFGMNESFAGIGGLPRFRTELEGFVEELLEQRYNGRDPPRVVLVSPIAHERIERVRVDPVERNRVLMAYAGAMDEVAARLGVRFVDLFTPTRALAENPGANPLTINGIHPNDRGYWLVSRLVLVSLGVKEPGEISADLERLTLCPEPPVAEEMRRLIAAIEEKNELFFYRWRAVNGEYIYGRRKEPFGVENFPGEMRQLEEMIEAREAAIRGLAADAAGGLATGAGLGGGCAVTGRAE
jgi:hypothetical protein